MLEKAMKDHGGAPLVDRNMNLRRSKTTRAQESEKD